MKTDKSKITEEELICNYSGLPSTLSYCSDYESMISNTKISIVKINKIK